jgi:hypothetical protein
VGDSWKLKPNLTINYGLRYVRDTGRTDNDLAPIPALNMFNNQFYSGLGNRVNNPNHNFAPQLGFAWDPTNTGKTVIRGGIGLFYENAVWNNVLFDRPGRLQTGRFLQTLPACIGGVLQSLPFSYSGPNPCGQPIGQELTTIATLQADFQAADGGRRNRSRAESHLHWHDLAGHRSKRYQHKLNRPRLQEPALGANEHRDSARTASGNRVDCRLPAQRFHAHSSRS